MTEAPQHPQQQWNPDQYAHNAGFVAELGQPLVALLAPRAGERILDLGCGDGTLTQALAAAGCRVLGVDASAAMVSAAQARGVDAQVMDGCALTFDAVFDAVFSNAALHWMPALDRVFAGVWRALRPGGRFVAEMGAEGNVASITTALEAALARRGIDGRRRNPWFFPSQSACRDLLAAAGFTVETLTCFARPTPLPGCLSSWLETFAHSFLTALPDSERAAVIAEVVAQCRSQLCDADGQWTADYVRLRFHAQKPL